MSADVTLAIRTLLRVADAQWYWFAAGLPGLAAELQMGTRAYSAQTVSLVDEAGQVYLPRIAGDDVWALGTLFAKDAPGMRSDLFQACAEQAAQQLGGIRSTIRSSVSTRYTWPIDGERELDVTKIHDTGDVLISIVRAAKVPADEFRPQPANAREMARSTAALLIKLANVSVNLRDNPQDMQQLSDQIEGEADWEPGQSVVDFALHQPPFVARLWGPDTDDDQQPCYTELLVRLFWRVDLPEESLDDYYNMISSEIYKIKNKAADVDHGDERIWQLSNRLGLSVTKSPDRVDVHLRQTNRLPVSDF